MSFAVGVDSGGTFNDLVAVDDDGSVLVHKIPSDPSAPDRVLLDGLSGLAARAGLDLTAFLHQTRSLVHGSTVALNTLIQRRGARTGLLATAGHEDAIEIRQGHKEDGHRWDFRFPAAEPLVPGNLRLGVRERVLADGSILEPLDEQHVGEQLDRLADAGVEAVAVSLLWSFLMPDHEERIGEMVRERLPDAFVSLSSRVLPQVGEYTRTSTTAANAYIGPGLSRYLARIEQALTERGFSGQLLFMQSNGGVASRSLLADKPVAALNSGPAGGPVAARWFGRLGGSDNVIAVDMGGTSFDISVIQASEPDIVTSGDIARVRLGLPMVNVTSIGSGGGSIARVNDRGLLQVGPESAEADPGPACYGRGGTAPTVTDALLVLGLLPESGLLAGKMPLDRDASVRALRDAVAEPLGISTLAAARGVVRLSVTNMIDGIRTASVDRGHDPRDFVLLAGGGLGPVFAGLLAEELGISRVVLPRPAGALCAFGEAIADLRYDSVRAVPARLGELDPASFAALVEELEQEGRDALTKVAPAGSSFRFERTVEMKYVDQIHYCDVRVPDGPIDTAALLELRKRFDARHEQLYTYCEPENEPELLSVRVGTTIPAPVPRSAATAENVIPADPTNREATFSGSDPQLVPVYGSLPPGSRVEGPAIIEEETTTVVVWPGGTLEALPDLYLLRTTTAKRTGGNNGGSAQP
ncbi:MAG: hydantoinase/oxoprolinase family protein [Actinobacteria bacterium]|nr:hydantoinase/oxoprolinase family protein [Actinomycetota bacterium]